MKPLHIQNLHLHVRVGLYNSNTADSADLIEDSWQELRPAYGKGEEGRDVGEHTGQDEWVLGVVVQHGL